MSRLKALSGRLCQLSRPSPLIQQPTCSPPILSCLRFLRCVRRQYPGLFYEGIAYNVAAPTQSTCCKTCSMPPPGNAVGRHQSDVHLSPSVEADKTSAVSPSGREPHRTIMKMSTPRPRATPDHQEDVHTQAKSHTGLSRRRPHSGEEPHFTSPAEADTGHGPHRSSDDKKKQKNDLALLVSFPCCCGRFSFGVLCCPCFVAVLWRPRSRLCCVLAFCGSTLFFQGANPRTGLPSSFQVSPPSLPYAVGMQYGRGVYIYWVLLALMLFSRFTLEVQPAFRWSAVLSYLRRHPSPRSHFWDFRQEGADMDGLVAELCCKLRNRVWRDGIFPSSSSVRPHYCVVRRRPLTSQEELLCHANPVQNLSLQTATDPQAVKTAADTILVPTWTPLCVLSLQPPT